MYEILKKQRLNPTVTLMVISAPMVARKAEPGQFIILRTDEDGERIPLTVADYDRKEGTVTIIFQIVGATTMKLDALNEGSKRFCRASRKSDSHGGLKEGCGSRRRRRLRNRLPRCQKAS